MTFTLGMLLLDGRHGVFIAGAYAVAALVLIGLLAQSIFAARRNRAELRTLEKMAPVRRPRGQRPAADAEPQDENEQEAGA